MKKRSSNIELIRIIAMVFIVISHISIHAQRGECATNNYILSITTTGVNLFLLISGYFGIKLKWKNLLNILSTVIFFYVTSLIADYFVFKQAPSYGDIASIFTPISRNPWWFMRCYLVLMLVAPALNIIIANATHTQYKQIVITLTILSCISGFVFSNQYINHNGFTLFQFINMYLIGNTISRYNIPEYLKKRQWLLVYAISTIALFFVYNNMDKAIRYNNPFLIVAAISLFCLINKIKFNSKLVNSIATYMLPIYLIQDSPFGFKIYPLLYTTGKKSDFKGVEYFEDLGLYLIAIIIVAALLECLRKAMLGKLINKATCFLEKKANIFNG